MRPSEVSQELIDAASSAVWKGLLCPPPTEDVLRHALAAVLPLAEAEWNRRAQSAEEIRLRAEVASLRAALGQQPATEGAEPVGCPIPGMCAAVAAHAAAYRAGAEAMRERAAETAHVLRHPDLSQESADWCAGTEAAAAAIRALPMPAAPEGEG